MKKLRSSMSLSKSNVFILLDRIDSVFRYLWYLDFECVSFRVSGSPVKEFSRLKICGVSKFKSGFGSRATFLCRLLLLLSVEISISVLQKFTQWLPVEIFISLFTFACFWEWQCKHTRFVLFFVVRLVQIRCFLNTG